MNQDELYSQSVGQGEPLLLIAGVASDHLSWQLQSAHFQDNFQVISYDNRGVGRSPLPNTPLSIESMALDALAILDRYQVKQTSILAHSMGSAIAQHLALHHPDRVKRMVLASPFTHVDPAGQLVLEGWVQALESGVGHELFARIIFPWLFSREFLSTPGCFDLCLEGLKSQPYPLKPEGLRAQVNAIRSFDSRAWASRIQTKTLVLAGAEDLLIPLGLATEITEELPEAKLEVLAGAGHSGLVDKSEEFNKAVLRFLTSD